MKIITMFCCTAAMFCSAYAAAFSPELDPAATQAAPWRVGEIMAIEAIENDTVEIKTLQRQRTFLGVTTKGHLYVQEFYVVSDQKYTSPYVMEGFAQWGYDILNGFDLADSISRIPSYTPIIGTGTYTVWYPDGGKWAQGNYVNGLLEGAWQVWYPNGEVAQEINYKESKKEGLEQGWHANGQKAFERFYTHDIYDGDHKSWYESGQLEMEKHYCNNMPCGIYTEWYENGKKAFEVHYTASGGLSKFYIWHENGQLAEERYVIHRLKDGDRIVWDESGRKTYEIYHNKFGELDRIYKWDEKGNLEIERYKNGELL